ncbi:hypothetical protein GCM10011357_11080 [Lacimicrobium alkaliphilum]|uniref:Spore protein YkvP/CgeB glycosyl transferase-like domain-containing protein n=2 Tax=Lacimicrobium alkaliphilum TaxID=1526571 RepID=A0ABQ1R639_9ALTE|nr:hypothetical protein GCM10011357_11080 [Lacimicrobium alkaliphilum]
MNGGMTSFCIASPHKNELWYDYRVYVNLRQELEALGYQYRAASQNRIYFLGGPQRHFYPEVGKFDAEANNIALIYCHVEKLKSIDQFRKVFVCSEGMKGFLQRRRLMRLEPFRRRQPFTPQAPIEVIPPFSSLQPCNRTRPRYQCDLSFVGTPRIRPILEAALPVVKSLKLKMHLYGPNWDQYPGNPVAKDYWIARSVPYEEIPMLAKGSKICLIDHHDMMNKIGTVSHKYVDFLKAGAFVISDNNRDARKHYHGVYYRNQSELAGLIEYYVTHDAEREATRLQQQRYLNRHSTGFAATELAKYFI